MFGLEAFKMTPLGQQVGTVLSANLVPMIALSESGIPAVQAIGKRLMPLMAPDDDAIDVVKKNIGRWVREILEAEGWTPVAKGRVAPGNLFSTGAIYGQKQPKSAAKIAKPFSGELEKESEQWASREQRRLIELRDCLFKDPGGGVFRGIPREFVLSEPANNLWEGIRADAIDYFAGNKIRWWGDHGNEPTGHMLSSQIACVNHLYLLRQRSDLAIAVLRAIDPEIVQAEIVDDGYVEFEFIGKKQYLQERKFSRGTHCTSVDAFMIGRATHGGRRAFLVEWKYIEAYPQDDKYIPRRARVYDGLITAENSPFKQIERRAFYFDPFYQMMRQTLLGWQITKQKDYYGCTSYRHVYVVPEQNVEFRRNVTAQLLKGANVSEAWCEVLRNPEFYIDTTPANFMRPILDQRDTKALTGYLERRYWSAI